MTKRHLMTLRLVLLLGDAVAAWLVFLVVSRLRFDADPNAHWSVGLEIGTAAILFAVMWVAVLWAMGLYRIGVRWSLLGDARDLAKATVVALAVTLSLLFLTHQDAVSRVFLAALFVAQPAVTLAGRGLLRFWFDSLRRRGAEPQLHARCRDRQARAGIRRSGRGPSRPGPACHRTP